MNIRPSNLLQGGAPERLPTASKTRDLRARVAVFGVLALIVAFVAWRIFGASAPQPKTFSPPPVRVAVAQEKSVTGFQHSIGTVVPLSTVQVTSLVTGQLLSTGFTEGQIVRAGQLLFQIDPRPLAAALAQAKATLARDQANTVSAEHDMVRFTTLAAQGAASAQQRDQAIAAAKADEATVAADKAAIQTAELNLGYTRIVAPITGKTGPILIQPGNLVTANNTTSPLVTITQLQPIKVSMFLPQSDLPMIQQQMAAHRLQMMVNPNAGATTAATPQTNAGLAPVKPQANTVPSAPPTAPVNFVGNQVDPKTGTVELRATFDNNDFRLVPGQLLDAAVSLSSFPNAIVVPRDAVNIGPESRYVFVVGAGDRAQMRPVNVLYDDGVHAAIEGAVKPGDRVIVEGQLRVLPDKPVQILGSAPARAGT
ncbi:MAG TPA: efflux RND transporter periplasmic adaptor subunit [Rhizomicrobium sp.]|jgi:multidrug efflux system membrane fusion protein|nr:efflux RND transporter periplasmic adaptor subunit [Rhizomicrobium sp.]